MLRLTWIRYALLAVLIAGSVSPALALSPDDAIYLTQEGVPDEVIIAKICADGEAWDLTSDEIVYLGEQGISIDVVNALMDPAAAAEQWGFTLGTPEEYPVEGEAEGEELYLEELDEAGPYYDTGGTSLIFSMGFYYGPLSVHYFSDPFYHCYLYAPGYAFSYAYWPRYYRWHYNPPFYACYTYPYYAYDPGSYYCGGDYVSYRQRDRYREYARYAGGRWREYEDPAYAAYGGDKPPAPEKRVGRGGHSGGGEKIRDRVSAGDPPTDVQRVDRIDPRRDAYGIGKTGQDVGRVAKGGNAGNSRTGRRFLEIPSSTVGSKKVEKSNRPTSKRSAALRSNGTTEKRSAIGRSAGKVTSQPRVIRGSRTTAKRSATLRSNRTTAKRSATLRSNGTTERRSAIGRSAGKVTRQPRVVRSNRSSVKRSGVAKSTRTAPKKATLKKSSRTVKRSAPKISKSSGRASKAIRSSKGKSGGKSRAAARSSKGRSRK